MLENNDDNTISTRVSAFESFKKIALAEQANGAETLVYRRLVPRFSTAPLEETKGYLLLMNYWSRNGHGEWLVEAGTELLDWAKNNGYHHR